MIQYNSYARFFLLSLAILVIHICNAQEPTSDVETIYVNIGVETQVKLPVKIKDLHFENPAPPNDLKYYILKSQPSTKSFTIRAKEKNPDPGIPRSAGPGEGGIGG